MMDFLANYGLFLAKLVSLAAVIILVILIISNIAIYAKSRLMSRLEVRKLNDKYDSYKHTLTHALHTKKELKAYLKLEKQDKKRKEKIEKAKKRLFVLDFHGDIRASAVMNLREEVTALLTLAEPTDEVLVRLDSSGGLVHAYGLAASQLKRIKDAKIPLTVAIDKIAASGGYMMACVADRIIAAPFAVVGSIGVIAQLPNFHRYLQKKSIDFEQITAGEFKRTLTVLGENTDEKRAKMQEEINEIHQLFKKFIIENRPDIDIDQVATGEHWYATHAINLKLLDALQTSDDYLLQASKAISIFELHYKVREPFSKRFTQSTARAFQKLLSDYQTKGRDYL